MARHHKLIRPDTAMVPAPIDLPPVPPVDDREQKRDIAPLRAVRLGSEGLVGIPRDLAVFEGLAGFGYDGISGSGAI
jgi:hypothetical protein